MSHREDVALTALPRELTAETGKKSPKYRTLWQMVVDGDLPAEQVNGRYHVNRADIPAIAIMLGMVAAATQPAPRARNAAVMTMEQARLAILPPKRRKTLSPNSIAA